MARRVLSAGGCRRAARPTGDSANSAARSAPRSATVAAPAAAISSASSRHACATVAIRAVGPQPAAERSSAACARTSSTPSSPNSRRRRRHGRDGRARRPRASRARPPARAGRERPQAQRPVGVARAPSDRIGRHLPGLPAERAVVLAQIGGQVSAVLGARVAGGPERARARARRASARAARRGTRRTRARAAGRSRLRWVSASGRRGAELAAEDHADGHRPVTSAVS